MTSETYLSPYRISSPQQRDRRFGYQSRRDVVGDAMTTPLRWASALVRRKEQVAADGHELIWALHDVAFAVQQGEVGGIIGRNGTGQSTLLKILARITEPTSGEVMMHGQPTESRGPQPC